MLSEETGCWMILLCTAVERERERGFHFGRSPELAAMEMIFRFSGDGKLVHATGPPQAKIWKIVRAFATICT